MRSYIVLIATLSCLVSGCSGNASEEHSESSEPTGADPLECEEDDDGAVDTDKVTLRDEGWTTFDAMLEGYHTVNYAALFDASSDVAVDGVTIRLKFLDSSGETIESESDPDGALVPLSTPGSDNVLAATDSVTLSEEPSEAEFEFTRVCWRPLDSEHYGTVDVSNSDLSTEDSESAINVQFESTIDLEATGTIYFVFRDEADEIVGGTTDDWPEGAATNVKPGQSERTMEWEWTSETIAKDEIFPDKDLVTSAEAHIMLQLGRAHTQ